MLNQIFSLLSTKNLYQMRQIFLSLILLFFISCGIQKQLNKAYIGKTVSELTEKLGNPKTVIDKGDEKDYVFEKTIELKSAEISQGKLTLDPMVSPMAKKTERYYFTVTDGKVVTAKMEEEYER
jgi:hypothetical protein